MKIGLQNFRGVAEYTEIALAPKDTSVASLSYQGNQWLV